MQCSRHLSATHLFADAHAPCKCSQNHESRPICQSALVKFVRPSRNSHSAARVLIGNILRLSSVNLENSSLVDRQYRAMYLDVFRSHG